MFWATSLIYVFFSSLFGLFSFQELAVIDEKKREPFRVYSEEGIEGLVSYLEKHPELSDVYYPFDPHKADLAGFNLFFTPGILDNPNYVRRLLIAGYSPSTAYKDTNWTILHESIGHPDYKNTDSVRLLLEHGANANSVTKNTGLSPLDVAALWAKIEVATLLLQYGADINIKDKGGSTPIMKANNIPMARFLMKHGADIHALNDDGMSLLHLFHFKPKLVKFFLEQGVSPHIKDKDGETALDSYKKHYEKYRCDCADDTPTVEIIRLLEESMTKPQKKPARPRQ